MVSRAAQVVISTETELRLPGSPDAMQRYLEERYGAAPVSSRSSGGRTGSLRRPQVPAQKLPW